MSNIQPYIILNDIDSRTISGLLISSLPPISKPLQRTQVETVDGRDGDLVTPLGFSAYDKVITIGLTYGYDIDDVIEYFNSEGVVVFSNEPDKFYRYAIYEQIDFEKLIRFKKAEVTLHCQPFKFSTTEETKLFNVVSGQNIVVKNNGNIDSRPDITVIGSGNVDVSLNGSQILSLALSDNQAVIIDSEDMNAYAAQSAIREVIAEVNAYQEGSGDSSPDNERSIIGFNGACINLCGINQWNEVSKQGYTITGAGVETPTANAWCSQDYIPLLPNTTYYLKSSSYLNARWYDANKNYLGYNVLAANSTFNSTSAFANARYLRFNGYGVTYNNDISINYPSTDTEYHAYIGSKYQSYFEGLLNGTYGFVDLGTLTWAKDTTSLSVTVFRSLMSDRKAASSSFICSKYPTLTTGRNALIDTNNAIASWNIIDSQIIAIRDDSLSSGTADDFKNAMDGVYLIYELASVTTPTITQEEINTLLQAFGDSLIVVVFGQKVYGATLDVTTGKLTITHWCDNLGDLTWNYGTDGSDRFVAFPTKTPKTTDVTTPANIISDIFSTVGSRTIYNGEGDYEIAIHTNGAFWIRDTDYSDKDIFKSAMANRYVVYEVINPIEITLTPAQVNNLLGVNTLYTDTNGDITVSHKSNGIIVTNTGAIVSFTVAVDDMEKGALLNRLVTGDYDKIRLKKGNNTLVLTGNAQQLVIDKYSRWI